jgi:hypothetical protein
MGVALNHALKRRHIEGCVALNELFVWVRSLVIRSAHPMAAHSKLSAAIELFRVLCEIYESFNAELLKSSDIRIDFYPLNDILSIKTLTQILSDEYFVFYRDHAFKLLLKLNGTQLNLLHSDDMLKKAFKNLNCRRTVVSESGAAVIKYLFVLFKGVNTL